MHPLAGIPGQREGIPSMKDRPSEVFFYEWGISRWLTSRTRMELDCSGRSIYRELLDLCYAQGSMPNDPETLIRHCACTQAEWDKAWPVIARHFHKAKNNSEALVNDFASVFRKNYFEYRKQQSKNRKSKGKAKANPINKLSNDGKTNVPTNVPPIRTNEYDTIRYELTANCVEATEWPLTAAAVRGYFASADDVIVLQIVQNSVRAYVDVVNGKSGTTPLTDEIVAQAVHEAYFKKQTSAGLFPSKVPRVIKTWAEEALRNGSIH